VHWRRAMRIRMYLGILSIAAVALVQPAAHASRSRGAPVKKIAAPRASGKTIVPRRFKPFANGLKRKSVKTEAARQKKASSAGQTRARPSIAHNVGWGTFFAAVGTASAVRGEVFGTVVGAAATAYNAVKGWLIARRGATIDKANSIAFAVKGWLIARRGATIDKANSIAFNAGWGTFWSGVRVHGLAAHEPLAAAIGLGAGAYNLYKAARNTRALPGTAE